MAAADYRLMSEATGQRIAAALEALSGFGAYLTTADVVDNLTSTSTTAPLSANMGKTLEEHIQQSTAGFIKSATIQSSSKTVHVLNIRSGERHFIIGAAASAGNGFCALVSASGSGNVTVLEAAVGQNVTLTASSNTLTVTLATSNGIIIADFIIYGEGPVTVS